MKTIALVLNINKPYDRQIVKGVARFAHECRDWSLYLEDDPLYKIPDFNRWPGHGIIADLDDPLVYETVKNLNIPVVGFGGGYGLYSHSEESIPYVYTDNCKIAELAAEHLIERGFCQFAYCGFSKNDINGWDTERCNSFQNYIKSKGMNCTVFNETATPTQRWDDLLNQLEKWLCSIPKPFAIMAANDSRARHILEACRRANICVPEEVAVIGVDDDPMMCEMANPPLSSVTQGTDKLGYEAARILSDMINGKPYPKHLVIEPLGINTRQSSDILAINDPLISMALHFIRANACNCIQVEDVANHCGVSRSTLDKKFQQIMATSVHAEIAKSQLHKAKELLKVTDLPLKRIAEQAGFSTVQYMTMKLKNETGLTPKLFRLKSRQRI